MAVVCLLCVRDSRPCGVGEHVSWPTHSLGIFYMKRFCSNLMEEPVSSPVPVLKEPPGTTARNLRAQTSFGLFFWDKHCCFFFFILMSIHCLWPRILFLFFVFWVLFFMFLYWNIVDLLCCANFFYIAKWFSYTYAYSFSLWFVTGYWI